MRLTIPRAELKTAVDGLNKVVPRRTALAVLRCVRVEAANGRVRASATDLDQAVTYEFESATMDDKPAVWLLELEQLKALSGGSGDRIEIEADRDDNVAAVTHVGGQPVRHTLRLQNAEEWPASQTTASVAQVDSAFLERYRKALPFSSDDPTRYALTGVCLDVSDKRGHYVVATDGRRLTALNSLQLPLTESLILPASRFLAWNKLTGDVAIGTQKAGDAQWLRLIVGKSWDYSVKAIQGTYPNWRQVVPSEDGGTKLVIGDADRDMLGQALRTFPGHDVASAPIRLSKRAGKLLVSGKGAEDENWTDLELPNSRLEGKSQAIGVNREFLIDALAAGFSTFTYADEHGPLVARNESGVHCLMPVRTADEPSTPVVKKVETTRATKETAMGERDNGKTEATALDRLLAAHDLARLKIRETSEALVTIAGTIKDILREDKQRRAEVESVRAGLAKLQAIRV